MDAKCSNTCWRKRKGKENHLGQGTAIDASDALEDLLGSGCPADGNKEEGGLREEGEEEGEEEEGDRGQRQQPSPAQGI